MTFEQFERRAHEIFDGVPPEYRRGVDGLSVIEKARLHPSLPDIYTLGECRTESYPSEFGGAGDVRSIVVLFYGSFVALSRKDEKWDWEEELWETITHEIRHHLESLATEDALELQDYVEDQNFARRDGGDFDPFFYRSGEVVADGAYSVDGDVFIEQEVDAPSAAQSRSIVVGWASRELTVPLPDALGDVHFVTLRGHERERGDLIVVLVRRRGLWDAVLGAFAARPPEVLQSEVEV